jgi:hypothetical protein
LRWLLLVFVVGTLTATPCHAEDMNDDPFGTRYRIAECGTKAAITIFLAMGRKAAGKPRNI